MLESMLVTHASSSQEGIKPIAHCSNQTHYTLSYLEIMKSCSWVLIECESQLESSPKFKILNRRERKRYRCYDLSWYYTTCYAQL